MSHRLFLFTEFPRNFLQGLKALNRARFYRSGSTDPCKRTEPLQHQKAAAKTGVGRAVGAAFESCPRCAHTALLVCGLKPRPRKEGGYVGTPESSPLPL